MTPEQREAWLKERRTGIGGSDAPAAVGLSKWKTPLELWLDKRGELETPENEPMKWGTLLEPVVRQEYANRTGRTVTVPNRIIRHPIHAFAIVNLDGIADEARVLECKTARTADGWGDEGSADIPQEYLLQVQHAMLVSGLPVADVAVLIGGQDFRLYQVESDRELQQLLIEQEAAFWKLVEAGEPPAPINREDVKRRWRITNGTKSPASESIESLVHQIRRAKDIKSAVEEWIDERSAEIQDFMGEAAELVTEDGSVLATWRNVNVSRRFDAERFKEDHPELYKQYLRDGQPSRRFLLKVKGTSQCQVEQLLRQPQMETAKALSS